MLELIKGTWLATALFTMAMVVLLLMGLVMPLAIPVPLVVVPSVWWPLVARRGLEPGRGAVAGILCAAIIVLIPTLHLIAAVVKFGGPGEGEGGLTTLFAFVVMIFAWILTIPVGAGLGALAALLQSRWLETRSP